MLLEYIDVNLGSFASEPAYVNDISNYLAYRGEYNY